MVSSKSSIDNRDVYYRLGKSAGYRARSAYKLLHLDEEFDLFNRVQTAVDLCAAPGSWSQVLGQKLRNGSRIVAVDLQPMAPLPNVNTLQADITLPATVTLVLNALDGQKADLVVCDGAPDVTGVHDLDAYLHSQLLLAALQLALTLLAPASTLIFKIFLSPLDPQAAMLRSQLEMYFTSVTVRKPRSSRQGSGEAFLVCRGYNRKSEVTAFVASGDLDPIKKPPLTININPLGRGASSKSIKALHPQPTPSDDLDSYFGLPESRSSSHLLPPRRSTLTSAPVSPVMPEALPTPRTTTHPWEGLQDGAVSPALSSSSKTDVFFASNASDGLPTPPRPISRSTGLGVPSGTTRSHDRAVSLPTYAPKVDLFPSPLSTLPSYPDAMPSPPRPAFQKRESVSISREHREIPRDATSLASGDVLSPCADSRQYPVDPGSSSWRLRQRLGDGAFSSVWSVSDDNDASTSTIFAAKLTARITSNPRTRIAFLREVSVLRHISHPNTVSFHASFSTVSHHCLILDLVTGGELFNLISDDSNRTRLSLPGPQDAHGEGFIRRMFGELVRGVAWLHKVGVVHRDIKLENILLAANPFLLQPTITGSVPLDLLPSPLVKLTDFGLSRFINPDAPLLQTRCGSESFAAPEIIMGRQYDGRETDAWATGVVLFALVTGELPFDAPDLERKKRMLKIAKGEYAWPKDVGSQAIRSVVSRLLVRDPRQRARVVDLEVDFAVPIVAPKPLTGGRLVEGGFVLEEAVEEAAWAE